MARPKNIKAVKEQLEEVIEEKHDDAPALTEKQLYKTTKAIDAAIVAAGNDTKKVMLEYQVIGCSVALHLAEHHDIRVVRNLLASFHEGMRKAAMSAFLDKFATLTFDEEGECHYAKDKKLNLADALKTSWWKVGRPEAAYRPFNMVAELKALLGRAKAKVDKANPDKGDLVNFEMVGKLQVLAEQLDSQFSPKPKTEAQLDAEAKASTGTAIAA